MQDLIGRTLGHYRIVELIGEGGMGEVHRARDERLDRDVAVKVLPASVAQDPERIARFEREARAVARPEHQNILAIYDFGTDEDVTYSVTELLEGETLRERIVAAVGFHWNSAEDLRLNKPPSSYDALVEYRRGWKAFGSDFEEAEGGFKRALELDPGFHAARLFLIVSYWNLGAREDAAREISEAKKYRQDFTEFEQTGLDWCTASMDGKRLESFTHVRRLVKMAPQIPGFRYQLANEAYRLNRPQEAVEVLGPILPTLENETSAWAWWVLWIVTQAQHVLGEYGQELIAPKG